jgi:hypothetical protein
VRERGGRSVKYEDGLAKIIKFCEAKTPEKIPPDFACALLLDNADETRTRTERTTTVREARATRKTSAAQFRCFELRLEGRRAGCQVEATL